MLASRDTVAIDSTDAVDPGIARLVEEQAALRRIAMLVARGADRVGVFAAVAEEVGRLRLAEGQLQRDPEAARESLVRASVQLADALEERCASSRYASADSATIIVRRQAADLLVEVTDDGKGGARIPPPKPACGA